MSYRDVEILSLPTERRDAVLNEVADEITNGIRKIQALLCERRLQGLPEPWVQLRDRDYWPFNWGTFDEVNPYVQVRVTELVDQWPRTVADRLDRALRNLGRTSQFLGEPMHLPEQKATQLTFATRSEEMGFAIRALKAQTYLDSKVTTLVQDGVIAMISPAGWNRIAELEGVGRSSAQNPAFVAMWFGNEQSDESPSFMNELFDETIKAAITRAGYRCDRVDLVPHNDFVMDKIIGMIRAAPFVVADFTGNRNGVYFEAGFARGLGIPVIHSCRRTHFDDAHFDIKQINTLVWETPDQFRDGLYYRILGTLGKGPHQVQDDTAD